MEQAVSVDRVGMCVREQGDLQFFETCPGGEPGLRERLKNVLQNDFVRMTYTELVDLVRKDAKEGKVCGSVPLSLTVPFLLKSRCC